MSNWMARLARASGLQLPVDDAGPGGADDRQLPALSATGGTPAPTGEPEAVGYAPSVTAYDRRPFERLRREETPVPLGEQARRFLRPLVGVDPGEVRFYRGAAANQVATAMAAEALVSGDEVALAAGHAEERPETLGLLAHELTHVARRRDARFVPPVLRDDSSPPVAGEEPLAGAVEARVSGAARRQFAPSPPASPPVGAPAPPEPAREPQPAADEWGGLPAPWEPLPTWLTRLQAIPPSAPAPPPVAAPAPVAAPIQLAAIQRELQIEEVQSQVSSAAPEQPQAPAPDLDALARQVYAVLRRKLATERRRLGM